MTRPGGAAAWTTEGLTHRRLHCMGGRQRRSSATKSCAFCGNLGNMSKEHAWPQWLKHGATVEPTQWSYSAGFTRASESAYAEAPSSADSKQGSVLTTRLREVCRECNGGWMSRLEMQSQPLLKHLWAASYPLGQTALSVSDAKTVSAWAVKTAWIRELQAHRRMTVSAATRKKFAGDQIPPPHCSVWIARHEGDFNLAAFLASAQVSHRDDPWHTHRYRHLTLVTLVVNGVAICVRSDSGEGIPWTPLPPPIWQQFWPVTESVAWPPDVAASDDYVYREAHSLHRWIRVDPDLAIVRAGTEGLRPRV